MTATSEIPALSDAPANRTPASFGPATASHNPAAASHNPAVPSTGISASSLESLAPLDGPDANVPANRSFVITWLLSLLFGLLGLDRFFTGRYSTGALKALSLGGLGIWWIIDLAIVLAGGLRYGSAPLRGYARDKEIAWIGTGLTLIVAYSLQLDALIGSLLVTLF